MRKVPVLFVTGLLIFGGAACGTPSETQSDCHWELDKTLNHSLTHSLGISDLHGVQSKLGPRSKSGSRTWKKPSVTKPKPRKAVRPKVTPHKPTKAPKPGYHWEYDCD